jgi:hypothetical protein
MRIRVGATFVRGQLAYDGEKIVNRAGHGRFLRPRVGDGRTAGNARTLGNESTAGGARTGAGAPMGAGAQTLGAGQPR